MRSEAKRGGSEGDDSRRSGSSESSCEAERVYSGGGEGLEEGSRMSKVGEEPSAANDIDARRLQETQQLERLQEDRLKKERHVPVLLEQAVELLDVKPGLIYVDATAGAGGHLNEIIKRADTVHSISKGTSTVIGLDCDRSAIVELQAQLGNSARLAHANFRDIKEVLDELGISTVTGGIIADLGVSSMQLADPERGFSFINDGPLDMRADRSSKLTAEELINNLSEDKLRDIILKFGEERHARRIAREIVRLRPLHRTSELAEIVARCVPRPVAPKRKWQPAGERRERVRIASHPATRTFQAFRIAVNDELSNLQRFLRDALLVLASGGRLVVITFHSLEDRLVKQFFREAALDCICPPRQPVCTCHHRRELVIITPKPILAGKEEILANIRSRSAKLRAGEKLT